MWVVPWPWREQFHTHGKLGLGEGCGNPQSGPRELVSWDPGSSGSSEGKEINRQASTFDNLDFRSLSQRGLVEVAEKDRAPLSERPKSGRTPPSQTCPLALQGSYI